MDDDKDAWDILKYNFTDNRGIITPKVSGYRPTKKETEAIDYLFYEWDYTYEGTC